MLTPSVVQQDFMENFDVQYQEVLQLPFRIEVRDLFPDLITHEHYLVYALPAGTRIVAFVLICISLIVIGAAHHRSSIKRVFRHPMLTGVFIWATAHLLVNGTTRAVVLFGGLGIWALLEILLINKREGPYEKPAAPGFSEELKGMFFSAGILLLLLFLHPYFAGVTPFPR